MDIVRCDNFDEFYDYMINSLKDVFPDFKIIPLDSHSPGNSYCGINVMPPNSNGGIMINADNLYQRFLHGENVDALIESVVDTVEEHIETAKSFDVSLLGDYEKMKPYLVMDLVNTEANKEFLQGVPSTPFHDLSIIYRIQLPSEGPENQSFVVNNGYLKNADITPEQLREDAMKTAAINRPMRICTMKEMLSEITGMPLEAVPDDLPDLYVVSNQQKIHGAAAIVYPGFADEVAKSLDGDFYILPSSIHEVLLVPDDGHMRLSELQSMVRDVNATQVRPDEQLSDNVYHYDAATRTISLTRETTFDRSAYYQQMRNNLEQATNSPHNQEYTR